MGSYSLRDVRSMLGLSRSTIGALVDAGFVTPARGPKREVLFSFQDMVLLRTAHQLQQAQVPPRRILRALRRLRSTLPESMPLTGLRITAVGDEVVVRDGGAHWRTASGQLVMDFEIPPQPQAVAAHPLASNVQPLRQRRAAAPAVSADEWFRRACAMEAADAPGAERAYRRAIEADPQFADAYLNLGVLLGGAGRLDEAIALYRFAIEQRPDDATLHFNLGVMLEDAGQLAEAIAVYERCLELDATLADAHYNAARLHERLGDAKRAIRHYSAYRRLTR